MIKESDPGSEQELNYTERSNACKIAINAWYGVLGKSVGRPGFQAGVTGGGRSVIHNIRKTLDNIYGDRIEKQYGDTDSVFITFVKTYKEILSMTTEEAHAYFNGNGKSTTTDDDDKQIITLDAIADLYKEADDIMNKKSQTKKHKACYNVHKFCNRYTVPLINAGTFGNITVELEKVMMGYMQVVQKKYLAFDPLTDKLVVRGMSIVTSNSFVASQKILAKISEMIQADDNTMQTVVCSLYHFIGETIILPN